MIPTLVHRRSAVLTDNKTKEFKCREFPKDVNIQKGINRLSYGMSISTLPKIKKSVKRVQTFYIDEEDPSRLRRLSISRNIHNGKIDLCTVTSVSDSPSFPLPKKIKSDAPLLLTIFYGSTKELVLIFNTLEEKMEWWAGLEYFIQKAIDYRRINP